MNTIIAGSRTVVDKEWVFACVELAQRHMDEPISRVISGTARGVDRLGEAWAEENGVPCVRMPADWDTHGRSAGYLRNKEMAKKADALIAIWDGASRGTRQMIDHARKKGLHVTVFEVAGKFGTDLAPKITRRDVLLHARTLFAQ